ncbi:MAG: hypothetical protein JRI39_13145 [Deltaproteobacteria bacterium]|nr:hypothetical protein [Deltaproteobacteria bacterium]
MEDFFEAFETIDFPIVDDWEDCTKDFGLVGPDDFDILEERVVKKNGQEKEQEEEDELL